MSCRRKNGGRSCRVSETPRVWTSPLPEASHINGRSVLAGMKSSGQDQTCSCLVRRQAKTSLAGRGCIAFFSAGFARSKPSFARFPDG
eukprot:3367632-Rhodomonas_salina.1